MSSGIVTAERDAAQPLLWDVRGLWESLNPLWPGLRLEVIPQAASTNSVLLERIRGGASTQQACLLVAEHQVGGRGRMGRTWQSSVGASLTFSLALPLAAASWSGLSLAVGVALAEALEPAVGQPLRLGLKWPNDLWLLDSITPDTRPGQDSGPLAPAGTRGRKLGGILVETLSVGPQRMAVIGVGLNVLPLPAAQALGLEVASLSEIEPNISVPATLMRVAPPLLRALQVFEQSGFAPFSGRYAARDVLFGLPVVLTNSETRDGIAKGVTDDGALRVDSAQGIIQVSTGEVSVKFHPALASTPGTSLESRP
jgi:BirA family biotin operon repressor/biotin-[acetyl-CoA-carboxylase] ligase